MRAKEKKKEQTELFDKYLLKTQKAAESCRENFGIRVQPPQLYQGVYFLLYNTTNHLEIFIYAWFNLLAPEKRMDPFLAVLH